uniref:Secreted protein n=1 Tax=Tanacetum cinerariifolium TaxID=118510 RepID=A0A699UA72_TANCI|nr:hypothetical protein [Tanacetum cinerariifolium]
MLACLASSRGSTGSLYWLVLRTMLLLVAVAQQLSGERIEENGTQPSALGRQDMRPQAVHFQRLCLVSIVFKVSLIQ